MAAARKLARLLELADQGPVMRAALAEEVAALLADWPAGYPGGMKGACEALLAKAARDVDAATRARLRVQLHADPALAQRVLGARESSGQSLVAAARQGELPAALADSLGVDGQTARRILDDQSGADLAVACKGAAVDRATFSALAILSHPGHDRAHAFAMLDAFDRVPASEATRTLRGWRETAAA